MVPARNASPCQEGETTIATTRGLGKGDRRGVGRSCGGYGVGVLFWIVAITPQGIGLVEGVMAIVFTSLGVPSAPATVTALAFRGLGLWLPAFIGIASRRRLRGPKDNRSSYGHGWQVKLTALLAAFMGLVNVLGALTPALVAGRQILERLVPVSTHRGIKLASALMGFSLLSLAVNLWRRKRVAWALTFALLILFFSSHLLKGLDYEGAALAVLLAGWVWLVRGHFQARSDPPSIRQGLIALAKALIVTLIYGTLGFYLLDRHFKVPFGLAQATQQTVIMFTQSHNPGLEPISGFGRYFAESIYVVAAVAFGYATLRVRRPVIMRALLAKSSAIARLGSCRPTDALPWRGSPCLGTSPAFSALVGR